MAVNPGTYNFLIQRASDWSVLLQFKDSNNAAINLTGATVAAQAWDKERTTKHADFGVAYTSRSNGQVTISLTDAQTVNFPDNLYYDVLVTDSSGDKEYYLEGIITVDQSYTR
jgi:hypothetical protein|tara:strand:+ start:80 stop:418 length:339 start_codon:yes stop_codon:yes gene_type:complete